MIFFAFRQALKPESSLAAAAIAYFALVSFFPLIVLYGLWVRRPWAWLAALGVGLALLVWITVEILIIGYHAQPPLQLIYGVLGIGIVVLDLLPSVRAYYAEQ